MPVESKLEKVASNDPNRCQAIIGQGGQCEYRAEPNSQYCIRHGGNKGNFAAEKRRLHDYRLQQWQQRLNEFAASEVATSLRGEVGILRVMLEETMNMCKNPTDLHLYSSRIQDLVMKIDKVVNSVAKLDMRSGNLLDKSGCLILAGQIVEIIGKYITDPKQIDAISEELIDLVARLAGKETELETL